MGTRHVAEVARLAVESGIPADVFPPDWDGEEPGLYEDTVAKGTTLEIAQRIAQQKIAAQNWILDFGSRAVSLPRVQGETLRHKLDEARIPYATGSMSDAYFRRIRRVTQDHQEILRELAKR